MRQVYDYPPMIDEINAMFNVRGKSVIFAWGNIIYNPSKWMLPPEIIAHEKVHGERQGDDIEGWWHKYIDDVAFRRNEEIHAHHAEYLHIINGLTRPHRRRALRFVAKKLCHPLYGSVITFNKAREAILRGGV